MKKLKIPVTVLLAALLLLFSAGLPVLLLNLGDLGRSGRAVQEPLPYNLNVQQEPYSIVEKMNLIQCYDDGSEFVTVAETELIGSELWERGLVQDVVNKKLAAICDALGLQVPELEIVYGITFTVTDRRKPALSLRMWAVELQNEWRNCSLILDVDTGAVYGFLMGKNSEAETLPAIKEDQLFSVLRQQIQSDGSWSRDDTTALLFEEAGMATFIFDSGTWDFSWSPGEVSLITPAMQSESTSADAKMMPIG